MAALSRTRATGEKLAYARALSKQHRLHEAAWAYAGVVAEKPQDAQAWFEYGVTLAKLDDHRAALPAFEQAVAHRPGFGSAWNDRGVSLIALGRGVEAREAFERATTLEPRSASATANLAGLELAAGQAERAEALFRHALERDPAHGVARIGLGRALTRSGKRQEAGLHFERALTRAPASFEALLALVSFSVEGGCLAEASQACQQFLRTSPGHSGALGLWAELGRELGDEAALQLLDFERWVQVRELEVEPGLLDELAQLLPAHPSLLRAPPHHATRNGRHSAALSGLEHAAFARLEAAIEAELDRYLASQVSQDSWPGARVSRVALHLWGILLEGDAFQVPHLHPDAWLSGVFYVAVPGAPVGSLASQRGCLAFGPVDPELGLVAPRATHLVRPRPGRLALFPPWLYHSTVPHGTAGLRISVAFDCVRAG